ncbi:MAG: hypothetical protein JOY71_22420 [Acetobacteraceae bacterium]|nr:hypothetical protein [Acetobacteraceae bacterium]
MTLGFGLAAPLENGFVLLPSEAHWLADYLDELALFPNGRHDDQVDSTAQFLAWAKKGLAQDSFSTWMGVYGRPGGGSAWVTERRAIALTPRRSEEA